MDHTAPFFSINFTKGSPNLNVKYETKKNLNPLEIKLIKTKIIILNPIRPLVIVKTLNGKGVNPARKSVTSQMYIPLPSVSYKIQQQTWLGLKIHIQ